MVEAPPSRRARLALVAFGYWHYGLILGVVGVAAGLKKAVGHPYDPLDGWIGSELAVGVALFVACTAGFTATLGLGIRRVRLVAAARARPAHDPRRNGVDGRRGDRGADGDRGGGSRSRGQDARLTSSSALAKVPGL